MNGNISKMFKNLLFLQYAILLLNEANRLEAASASYIVGHYHHNKRQQPSLVPTLTLDVEPHHGIEPSHAHPLATPDYYFPVDAGLFNFTCTIKHPSFKFKLTMTREQIFNNGEKSLPMDMIDPSDYVRNPSIQDERISVEYSEPTFLDPTGTARYLRVSLLIKNLKLEDNGIYTCKYSTISKKVNTVVYKPVSLHQISFPVTKIEKLHLNQPVTLTCRVNEIYPRPKISFVHSNKENLSESAVEKDISNTKHNEYYPYTLTSSITFTPSYNDNNENINCLVTSFGAQNNTITKGFPLQVHGIQIIENECSDSVVVKIGDLDVKITCVFFSNPKLPTSHWETTPDEEKPKSESIENELEASSADSLPVNNEPSMDIIKIADGEELLNYNYYVEEYGTAHSSGLYRAVLKIKEIRKQDIKNYTIKLDKLEKTINLIVKEDEVKKDTSFSIDLKENSASITNDVRTIHSASYALACASLILSILF